MLHNDFRFERAHNMPYPSETAIAVNAQEHIERRPYQASEHLLDFCLLIIHTLFF